MRERPWLEPRTWSRSNCSSTVTSAPRSVSAHAAAQPITPAPTTATRVTRVSLPERPRYFHARLVADIAEVELARRPCQRAPVRLGPARDGVVGAEDLRKMALL